MEKLINELTTIKRTILSLKKEKLLITKRENIGSVDYINAEKDISFYNGAILIINNIISKYTEHTEPKRCKICKSEPELEYSYRDFSMTFTCSNCGKQIKYFNVKNEDAGIALWNKEQENER